MYILSDHQPDVSPKMPRNHDLHSVFSVQASETKTILARIREHQHQAQNTAERNNRRMMFLDGDSTDGDKWWLLLIYLLIFARRSIIVLEVLKWFGRSCDSKSRWFSHATDLYLILWTSVDVQ